MAILVEETHPGIHPKAKEIINSKEYSEIEKKICNYWKQEWYITFAGHMDNGNSMCNYLIAKPTERLQDALGINREIIVIFSRFSSFEARSLDFFGRIYDTFSSEFRLEKICYVLISACPTIEDDIRKFISNQESQIIIPLSYSDFNCLNEHQIITNQFRKYFYSRDLFGINDPLKKEYFFFGRDSISMDIISKHRNGQNAGLFGLRKTGKTSIVFDIIRKSQNSDILSIFIDCQNTSFNMRHWNYALYYSLQMAYEQANVEMHFTEDQFVLEKAAYLFERGISELSNKVSKSVLLLFDEIENITPGKSSSEHWCNDLDFVFFWQSIRSAFQRTNNLFTYCILGTNPTCIEKPSFGGKDNPIYNAFIPQYIPGFDQPQTREMVRKLGRVMGMKFEEEVYTHLTEEYGGHPFLMRQVCSEIAKKYPNRPVQVDRYVYNSAKNEFNRGTQYFEMLLEVLVQFYPDEFEMLKFLATNDYDTFNAFATADYSYIAHLKGYSIIKENAAGKYEFKIDALKDYLLKIINKAVLSQTPEERWKEICDSRNKLEIELRRLVKTVIRFSNHSEAAAKEYVISKLYGKSDEARKAQLKSYGDLFNPKITRIFLKNLHSLIKSDYESFRDFFGDQEKFNLAMDVLNNEGRFDAHAKIPSDDDIESYNTAIKRVFVGIQKFDESME